MDNPISRIILTWYSRFDVFAGLMGGFEMVLSREWFWCSEQYLQSKALSEPQNLNWKIEHLFAKSRRIAMDMSTVFAKIAKGDITPEQFIQENEAVGRMIAGWKTELDPALLDERYLVMEYPNAKPLDAGDIVDPYVPRTIYRGPLWVMNNALIDWYSIDIMHRYQTALTLGVQPGPELGQIVSLSRPFLVTLKTSLAPKPGDKRKLTWQYRRMPVPSSLQQSNYLTNLLQAPFSLCKPASESHVSSFHATRSTPCGRGENLLL